VDYREITHSEISWPIRIHFTEDVVFLAKKKEYFVTEITENLRNTAFKLSHKTCVLMESP